MPPKKNLKQQTLFDMQAKKPVKEEFEDEEMEDMTNEVLQQALMESYSQIEEIKGGEEVKESFQK